VVIFFAGKQKTQARQQSHFRMRHGCNF